MSRPQLQPYVQGNSSTGHIVNGGLIDFQDNMNRGVAEYVITPSMIAAQQNQMQQAHAMITTGMPPMPMQVQPGNLGAMPFPTPACPGGPPQWVSGPASYYHVNGVMYAPIGDPVAQASMLKMAQAAEAPQPESAEGSHTVTMKEEDSGKRVTRQVQAYLKNKGKNPLAVSTRGGAGGSRKQKSVTAEELAAARVNCLNAAMPKGAARVDASIRRQW